MLRRFKIISSFLAAFFVLLCIYYSANIFSRFVEFSLKNYCKDCLASELTEESVTHLDHYIVFENPKLKALSNCCESALVAEKLMIFYESNLLKREVYLYVTLVNPKIDLSAMAKALNHLIENEKKHLSFFKIKHDVQIKNGVITYPNQESTEKVYFTSSHDFIQKNELNFKLNVACSDEEKNCMELHLFQDASNDFVVDVSFKDLCCKTINGILSNAIEGFSSFALDSGVLKGNAKVIMKSDGSPELTSDLVAKNLSFAYKPLNILGKVPESTICFSKSHFGHIDLKNALISFKPNGLGLEYNQLIGNCRMEVDLFNDDSLMSIDFKGGAEHLVSFFPDHQKATIEKSFNQDDLFLKGQLKKLTDANTLKHFYSFDGFFNIFSRFSEQNETIFFGFELEDLKSKIALQNGWFNAPHLKLDKYLRPFIFQDNDIKLNGYGNFSGTFDSEKINLTYNTQNTVLENEHFVMETEVISGAEHFYDFKTQKSSGMLPIKNGMYFDKKSGLLFTDINADFEVDPKKIKTSFIEAFCNGAYFAGSQELDLSSPIIGEFDLYFHVMHMKGKLSEMQTIFSHFGEPYFFLKIPLEADVLLRQGGGFLSFHFEPDDCKFQATVQGEVVNGVSKSDHFDLSVQDLNLNFDYNHQQNDFTFSDIQGTLIVGKPEVAEEYFMAGDQIRFTDYSHNASTFDFWIGDKNRDIIRLVGKTNGIENTLGDDLVEIQLDHKLSHFGDMQFTAFQCVLKDWFEVDTLNMDLKFNLKYLLNDLQRFSRTGFFFLSKGLLKELNNLKKANGEFFVNLEFDKLRSIYHYDVKANEMEIGSYKFSSSLLKGKKIGHIWSIDELKLDKLNLAADILYQGNVCKVNFLGIELGSSLTMGLEGEYDETQNAILAQVNFCEANFENLSEFAFCKQFMDEYSLKGNMRATGELKVDFTKAVAGLNADLLLNASFTKCQLKDLEFEDASQVSCHYVTDKGVILRGIKTAVRSQDVKIALLDIEKVEYELKNHAFSIEEMHFKLPSKNLISLTNSLEETFTNAFNTTALDILKNSKTEGFFEGSLNLDISNPHYALSLNLKDGNYYFLDKEHLLQNFMIDFDPCEFKLSTEYVFDKIPFWLNLHSKSATLEFGKLVLRNEKSEEVSPLSIYWRKDKTAGFVVETAEGCFSGLDVHLHRNDEKSLEFGKFHLTGDISFDPKSVSSLIPPHFKQVLRRLKIGSGYALKGDLSLFNGKNFDLADSVFKGELLGNDFEMKGYQFQMLSAEVEYKKNEISINKFQLRDTCGRFYADHIHFNSENDENWKINLPMLRIEEFRPSLTRAAGIFSTPSKRPFVIEQLELENFEGDLSNYKDFTGCGRFSFKNPHKKNLQNTILAIPAEIISRIGLDLTVLTPVIGTVEYQILDGKIMLTKFKDVYSEGRLSKFYLADAKVPSYVDFQGNLFVKVRMKHYNLLFKLAELFVVNVQGNLRKPTYSFQKQSKHEQEAMLIPISDI